MQTIVIAALVMVAAIHLIPGVGMLGPARLQTLYGLDLAEPNIQLLMRHRAVLFAMLGAFLLACAFKPEWRLAGLLVGLVSVIGFLLLAKLGASAYTSEIERVVKVDWLALGLLVLGLLAQWRSST
ncbi:MAG TPA: phosphopantetheine adenylyltransferase [Limnobacter sp.]|nr:phosphopantetheine adenylyltransferase [Limnobacter sp.]